MLFVASCAAHIVRCMSFVARRRSGSCKQACHLARAHGSGVCCSECCTVHVVSCVLRGAHRQLQARLERDFIQSHIAARDSSAPKKAKTTAPMHSHPTQLAASAATPATPTAAAVEPTDAAPSVGMATPLADVKEVLAETDVEDVPEPAAATASASVREGEGEGEGKHGGEEGAEGGEGQPVVSASAAGDEDAPAEDGPAPDGDGGGSGEPDTAAE